MLNTTVFVLLQSHHDRGFCDWVLIDISEFLCSSYCCLVERRVSLSLQFDNSNAWKDPLLIAAIVLSTDRSHFEFKFSSLPYCLIIT